MTTSHTESEIMSQPVVWRETLQSLDVDSLTAPFSGATDILVTGCGSTHYLAMSAAALFRDAGLRASAMPSSELISAANPRLANADGTVLLAISRSGTTTETVLAVENFRRLGGRSVAAVTCYADSVLAEQADHCWVAEAAAEQSVAQTRSFTSMQLVVQAIAGALVGGDLGVLNRLPELAEGLLESSRPAMSALAADPTRSAFYFLASGPLFGVASEAMLKLKEMSLTASEAYHALEFRHGPMSMCDSSAVVVGLVTPERAPLELAVLRDIEPMGPTVVTIGEGQQHRVPAELAPWGRPVLYLLPLQLLALERALAKGLDPDSPRHLTAVIHLDATAAS
jgi:glucosamine--fructose-6-phosphate aminotransferase (isomerizing)